MDKYTTIALSGDMREKLRLCMAAIEALPMHKQEQFKRYFAVGKGRKITQRSFILAAIDEAIASAYDLIDLQARD